MQSADNMKLGDSFAVSGSRSLKSLIERHGVGAGRILLASESAQTASCDTNVGGIDVAIDIEISLIPVHTLAHMVRHPPHGKNVAGAVKRERIVRAQPLTRQNFSVNRLQACIIGLKCVLLGREGHLLHDIAGVYWKS